MPGAHSHLPSNLRCTKIIARASPCVRFATVFASASVRCGVLGLGPIGQTKSGHGADNLATTTMRILERACAVGYGAPPPPTCSGAAPPYAFYYVRNCVEIWDTGAASDERSAELSSQRERLGKSGHASRPAPATLCTLHGGRGFARGTPTRSSISSCMRLSSMEHTHLPEGGALPGLPRLVARGARQLHKPPCHDLRAAIGKPCCKGTPT